MFMSSSSLFDRAQTAIPGGVNSPVRAFKGVGGTPIFFQQAKGAYLYDVDNKAYIDYIGSWGPMITGHSNPEIIHAIQAQLSRGLSFGAPTSLEIDMAEKVKSLMPSIDLIRMTSSGTEATMSAIRLARGFTGRDKILKFEGCYHGHSDSLLVNAGSGALTLGEPSSPGVPAVFAQQTLTATFNDIDSVETLFKTFPDDIACIIVEPIAGNMNCIPPVAGFLEGLRSLCDQYGSVLIFDEVMTGFRVALGGAQSLYQVTPDITTLGKILGGGLPVGAFGGKQEIMQQIAPTGPIYQAGTLSGNPIAMTAGLTILNQISQPNFHQDLAEMTARLTAGLVSIAQQHGIPLSSHQIGGMFGIFFSDEPIIERFEQVQRCNLAHFQQFFQKMLSAGVYLAPSAYEAGFVSSCHDNDTLGKTLDAADEALSSFK